MGWDAFSSAKADYYGGNIEDPEIDELFKNVELQVREKSGSVDALLRMGGLDCSDCAKMIEKATGRSAWSEDDWDNDTIIKLNKEANWDFEYDEELSWAYWSARLFLETCAKSGLSISFSY